MMRQALDRGLGRIIEITTLIGGIVVVLMMIHIFIDVVMRFFSAPLPGTMSIVSYYYMLVVTFVSLAAAERANAHISVEILYEFFPAWLKAVSRCIALLLCLAVFGLMAIKSWEIALDKMAILAKFIQGRTVIVTWPGFFLLPLGFGLMWLTCLMKLFRGFVGDTGEQTPEEPALKEAIEHE